VDDSKYEPQRVDLTPEVTQASLGKGFAGGMVGLALLTVLSLLWMYVHVHRRGPFGRKPSAVLRSLYPVVLGLGGWFAGVLLVTTTMETTPIDSPLLAVLGVGVPVGLGVYLAWVSAPSKGFGFLVAMIGALLGAWLGFHAGTDLLALITAIVGATAGANLGVVVLDIWRARSVGERAPGAVGAPAPSAEPRTI
jgi:hypothetical protein